MNMNLVNEIKASQIRTDIPEFSSGDTVKVSLERNQKYVTIYVEDTGKGISEKDLPHIKEKFYKANKEVRGSGIGLAVADEIIKQHQGLLFIESTEGVGTTVKVLFGA